MGLTSHSLLLIFDMDGVLVDVSDSYRATIAATVSDFTPHTPSAELIQQYKNEGGWNNDWELSARLIQDLGNRDVPLPEVVAAFQSHFLGVDYGGLILKERWLPTDGLLARLARHHSLAIFTGRPRAELEFTLNRFASDAAWSDLVADGEVPNPKPAPDGLLAIKTRNPGVAQIYVGDTVDDARSARAAGVRFIGIGCGETAELLRAEGAEHVLESVNELETVL